MYIFVPDAYQQSIFKINYETLKNAGIKIILFDLDNTIAPHSIDICNKNLQNLFEDIKNMGIKPVIMSNGKKKRVAPFKDALLVDAAYSSHKPFKKKYKKILNLYGLKPEESAAVGDQLLTDILGANRMGITSILVNPISTYDPPLTRLVNRKIEKIIKKHFAKREILIEGKYYE